MSLPDRLAFVDLETTGGNSAKDRITEIGIVRMAHGRIVDEWSSLVDPGVPIPPEIQALTGITQAMVRTAPRFEALAADIRARLAGHVFVAHNVRFDYGFLKSAYRRLGERFTADLLCTVRLSRRLFPQHARHGLDALVERHALGGADRHRALGDARLIARFYRDVALPLAPQALEEAVALLLKRTVIPAHLPEAQVEAVPEAPGVYVFRGIGSTPLYVGKAVNLSERVLSHFHADSRLDSDARLALEARSLDFEQTAGEFSALVREIELIRSLAPLYNVALRKRASSVFLQLAPPLEGFDATSIRFVPSADIDPACLRAPGPSEAAPAAQDEHRSAPASVDHPAPLYGPYASRQSARAALSALGREHRLCDKAIGLWRGERACFSRQLGRCQGLCCGEESAVSHHARLGEALAAHRVPPWPFDGPARFEEHDAARGLTKHLYFDHWCSYDPQAGRAAGFDVDVYKLLRRMLRCAPDGFRALEGGCRAAPGAPMPSIPVDRTPAEATASLGVRG